MTEWTPSAIEARDRYLEKARIRVASTGADPAEVMEDLRQHIDREIEQLRLTVVTSEDIRRILSRIGLPDIEIANGSERSPVSTLRGRGRFRRGLSNVSLVLFGLVLPAVALGFELVTGFCRDAFFDPIPSWGHIVLVAMVPLANLVIWWATRRRWDAQPWALGAASGASLAISLYYAALFLPILPIAFLGLAAVIYFGLGLLALLPMAPLLAFISGLFLRRRLQREILKKAGSRVPGSRWGFVAALLAALVVSAPDYVTKLGLSIAASESPQQSLRGIQLLRAMGNRDFLLRACYRSMGGPADLVTTLFFSKAGTSPDKVRTIFYRVTGEQFETIPPPRIGLRGRGLAGMDFDFDREQGGETVAGRLKGLSLAESRLDGVVDPDAVAAYVEWTMVFRNDHGAQREARAQILLPEGAVVSRVTLWINGEPREAAFGGRGTVRQAYERVVKQRRDPVLVTTCGPDRVLLQCFPVPPNGEMKVRIGITAPLQLENLDSGLFALPRLLERNFKIAEEHRHAVWIESPRPLAAPGEGIITERTGEGLHAVRGRLQDRELAGPAGIIRADRSRDIAYAWTGDPFGKPGDLVLQSVETATSAPPSGVVFVVDGSAEMARHLPKIAATLQGFPSGVEFAIVLASDKATDLVSLQQATPENLGRAGGLVRHIRCKGGMDNVAALLRAWDLLAATERGAIVWIHGPLPVPLGSVEELRQHFRRRPHGPILVDVQAGPGPNRVLEKLEDVSAVRRAPYRGGAEADLAALLLRWNGKGESFVLRRAKATQADIPSAHAAKGTDHLARLRALDEILSILRSGDKGRLDEAKELAVKYQLVTPISGAVVLETAQQYKDAGLNPADPRAVPVVPEPSTLILLAGGLLAARLLTRRRGRHPRV